MGTECAAETGGDAGVEGGDASQGQGELQREDEESNRYWRD